MNSKVSVVTVTFNCQDVVESTVRSVINQDYGNVEYIVVDGGSKDGTLGILNRYRSKFAYFISEKDNGIFDAMNKAIIASTGDWILFLNAGDILASANVLSGIFSKPYGGRVGVVFGDVYFKRATGISLWKGKPFFLETGKVRSMGICHQAIFVRGGLAKSYLFDCKFKLAADYNMMMQIYKAGYEFFYTGVVVSIYDLTGVSTFQCVRQFKEIYEICGNTSKSFSYYKGLLWNSYREFKLKIKQLMG